QRGSLTMSRFAFASLLVPASLCLACVAPPTDEVGGEGPDAYDGALTTAQVSRMLDLVNDPAVDVALLDVDVALDARAAKAIVQHRNGPDGQYPSTDDDLFGSIAELDSVAYVGSAALDHIRAYS